MRYGYQINYTCAVRATQILEPRCDVITEACHRFLDLTGPFQIGGLPSLSVQFQVENTRYVGCMRDVYIDGEFLDLNDYVWNNGTVPGCAQKKMHCQPGTCHNNGTDRRLKKFSKFFGKLFFDIEKLIFYTTYFHAYCRCVQGSLGHISM